MKEETSGRLIRTETTTEPERRLWPIAFTAQSGPAITTQLPLLGQGGSLPHCHPGPEIVAHWLVRGAVGSVRIQIGAHCEWQKRTPAMVAALTDQRWILRSS